MNPARQATVLVNAQAGGGAVNFGPGLAAVFETAGTRATVEQFHRGADLSARARVLARRETVLVAGGGDGTVSAVASAVVAGGGVLGVLPMGTLNHFAKDLGIPSEPAAAAAVVANGLVRYVDVGEVNGHIFVNNSSIGLYPRLVWEREAQRRHGHRKWIAFARAMARTWRQYRSGVVHLTVDGVERVIDTPFVFIGNNDYHVEGFDIGGRSSLTGGLLSVCVAPRCGRFDVARLVARALMHRLKSDAQFDVWSAQEVSIETTRHQVRVALDGEVPLMEAPLRYRIRPGALPVIVPGEP